MHKKTLKDLGLKKQKSVILQQGEKVTVENQPMIVEGSDVPRLVVDVDPGSASREAIAEVLSDLSILYRRMGGNGINFTPQDVQILSRAVHHG